MKKFLIILTLMIIIPLKVQASVTITNANIQGPSEAKIGEKIVVKFNLNIAGLDKTKEDSDGIYGAVIGLSLNEKTFTPTAIRSNIDSAIFKDKDTKDVRVIIGIANDDIVDKCKDSPLFCGSKYEVEVEFQINETTEKQAQIVLANSGLITFPANVETMADENKKEVFYNIIKEYTVNIVEADTNVEPAKDITLLLDDKLEEDDLIEVKKLSSQVTPPPTTTTATTKPKTTTTATTTEEEKQSRNTKIKNIEIKDAEYKFDNTKNYLEVFIYQKINSLDINLELEDPKSKYTIEGADDLKANGNRVKIEVIAENGQKKTYTLNVKIKDYKTQNDSKEDQEEVIVIFGQKIKKRYATYATWTICIIIALACFIFAIKFTKDRIGNKKYYKALKELEMTKNRRRKI